MNTTQHVLPEIEVDESLVKDALRALLHTVLFNRALGPMVPVEHDSDVLELSYLRCGVIEVDRAVEDAVHRFYKSLQQGRRSNGGASGQLHLSFFFVSRRKSFFGMAKEERVCWERFIFPVRLWQGASGGGSQRAVQERRQRQDAVRRAVQASILRVVDLVNSEHGHIPPFKLSSESAMVFPFEASAVAAASECADGAQQRAPLSRASPRALSRCAQISVPPPNEASESWVPRFLSTGPPMLT